MTPEPHGAAAPNKGYLHLDAAYLRANPRFRLAVPLAPRLLRPHPFTLQRVAALARGPLVYCVEDADHPWAEDHFKSLVLAPGVGAAGSLLQSGGGGGGGEGEGEQQQQQQGQYTVEESARTDLPLGESYVGVTLRRGGVLLPAGELAPSLEGPGRGLGALAADGERVDLHFVPYWARANRGGRGQMRVGIRTLD